MIDNKWSLFEIQFPLGMFQYKNKYRMFILYINMILEYKLNISFINIFAVDKVYLNTKIY